MPTSQLEHNELKTTEDFQSLVDAINGILCLDSDVEVSIVTSTHQKYDEAVRMVNDRLKQCDQLLQKGLRAEAIQQAQLEPKLIDVVTILDFDEQQIWNDYLQQCGFPRVPELLIDIADDLQTAWATEEPLNDLKYRHRLHALARSPLPVRIDILRRLAKADKTNPLWEDEVKIYEKTRLTEIKEECKAVAASNNLEGILALEAELKSNEWRLSLDPNLVRFAAAKSKEIQGKHARAHLVKLEPALNEAYSLSDVESARKLREEWGRHAAVAGLTENDPLMGKVLEPLKWLAEKDRQEREQAAFQAAVRELEQALDRKEAVKADFEPLYYKIEQFGRGIPENLQQRLTDRVKELDEQTTRRRRIKLAIIAASVIAVLLLIGTGIFLYSQQAELSQHVANLQGLIAAEQLDRAETYVSEREADNPRVYEHPDFQALIRELKGQVQADEDRRLRLGRLLVQAENTIKGLSPKEDSSLDSAKINKGYEALKAANQIAITEDEKAKLAGLLEQLNAKVILVQNAVDDRYKNDVAKFQQMLKALDPDAVGYSGKLTAAKTEAQTLKARKRISPDLGMRLVDPLIAQINAMSEQDQLARDEARFLANIREAVGDPNDYRLELDKYVKDKRFAGSARQRQFQQVLKNEPTLWVGFEEWSAEKRPRNEKSGDVQSEIRPPVARRSHRTLEKPSRLSPRGEDSIGAGLPQTPHTAGSRHSPAGCGTIAQPTHRPQPLHVGGQGQQRREEILFHRCAR